ncbi:hypothetical protein HIM_09721 [Hirsutella minnesotensis 3608]|uniref:Cytochrome P450 n=1 Tax=Hirsutella minnesotensis 3608 TaxID=1043627 RepID=A0A0F7ZL23_9HYPO|nr:hypothetical protein HIM_09721 [Hirsutella minnesotensis 3608]
MESLDAPLTRQSITKAQAALVVAIITITFPLITFMLTTLRFRRSQQQLHSRVDKPLAPAVVPYWFPFVGHVFSMIWNAEPFIHGILHRYGMDSPLTFKAAHLPLTYVCNPNHIQEIFKSSKSLPDNTSMSFFLKHVLGARENAIAMYRNDNSGTALKPFVHSQVRDEERVYFHTVNTFRRFLTGKHLADISQRYVSTLTRNLDMLAISSDWVSMPDLFDFLQAECAKAGIETVMGRKILELNPTIINDIRDFKKGVPSLLRCIPCWMLPKTWRARTKLHRAIEEWQQLGNQHTDCSRIGPDDPEWEPYFGCKLVRARQDYFSRMPKMDAHAKACEDLGLLYTINENTTTSAFWLIFEVLKDPRLESRIREEIDNSTLRASRRGERALDIDALLGQPLLQSCFAETLRLHVSSAALRVNRFEDYRLGPVTINKGHSVIIPTRPSALNTDVWASLGWDVSRPLHEFHAERFLVAGKEASLGVRGSPEAGRRFSVDGLAGLWIPFGGGHHVCPGRHFARMEMSATLALLLLAFDIELDVREAWRLEEDIWYYPNGAIPPKHKVPFRFRRRKT